MLFGKEGMHYNMQKKELWNKNYLRFMEGKIVARAKKDNVPFSVRLERGIYEKLCKFCEDSGQSKTVAVERALEKYVGEYYADKGHRLI